MKPIETERLILRPMTLDDATFILTLLNDPAFIRNIGDRKVRTIEDASSYILKGPIRSYDQHGFGLCLVVLKTTSEPIGICGLIKRDGLDDVDIGYALLPAFWSQGYATEAAWAVQEFAKNVVRLRRIVAITDPANQGSIRVLEKLGLKFEKMVRLSEDDIELRLYAIDF